MPDLPDQVLDNTGQVHCLSSHHAHCQHYFLAPNSFMHMFNMSTLCRLSIGLIQQRLHGS